MPDTEAYFWAAFILVWAVTIAYVVYLLIGKSKTKQTFDTMKQRIEESEKKQ